eukprot:scaffold1894_cov368-Prasinococcus_capsulatus_cf.AAC.7
MECEPSAKQEWHEASTTTFDADWTHCVRKHRRRAHLSCTSAGAPARCAQRRAAVLHRRVDTCKAGRSPPPRSHRVSRAASVQREPPSARSALGLSG